MFYLLAFFQRFGPQQPHVTPARHVRGSDEAKAFNAWRQSAHLRLSPRLALRLAEEYPSNDLSRQMQLAIPSQG